MNALRRGTHSSPATALLTASAWLGGVAAPAQAGVDAAWADAQTYTYKVTHAPDFDQKRAGLPGDGGAYCVPTSAVNWMAYFANHGASYIPPGPGLWQSDELYDEATSAIDVMGALMLTDPDDGTHTATWGATGLGLYLAVAHAPCSVIAQASDQFYSPTFQDVSKAVFAGGYVIVVVGWYDDIGGIFIERDGGHALTLTRGARAGDNKLIGWRDPASHEGDLYHQSHFSTEVFPVVDELVIPFPWGIVPRWMSRPVGYGNAYIDTYVSILPRFALSSTPDGLGFLAHPHHLFWDEWPPLYSEFFTPELTQVRALILHPDAHSFIYLAEAEEGGEPYRLWRTDRIADATEEVPIALTDPTDLLVSRRRGLYVLDDGDLVLYGLDEAEPDEHGRVTPPASVDAMCCDDGADEIVLLSAQLRQLIRYPHGLDANPVIKALPENLPLAGRVRMKSDRSRACQWVISEASDALYRLWEGPLSGELQAAPYEHPDIVAPADMDVDDDGRLFVSVDGMIREYEVEGEELVACPDPYFGNSAAAGEFLCILKSSTNGVPEIHETPAWRDVPPAQPYGDPIYDCPADLDDDRDVDTADLLTLLGEWGECPEDHFCDPDLNYSGAVDVPDLLELLASWGDCP
jgi:hypothetical protein